MALLLTAEQVITMLGFAGGDTARFRELFAFCESLQGAPTQTDPPEHARGDEDQHVIELDPNRGDLPAA